MISQIIKFCIHQEYLIVSVVPSQETIMDSQKALCFSRGSGHLTPHSSPILQPILNGEEQLTVHRGMI